MKKTFKMTHRKIKLPRLFEAVKSEVRRYIKRERRRELPEGVDFLDFDCKYGHTEAEAKVVHLSEITKHIADAEVLGLESFYIEIIGKPGHRTKKKVVEVTDADTIDGSIDDSIDDAIATIDDSIDDTIEE
jgi:hypothetical protein